MLETKCDVKIAAALFRTMSAKEPGSCTFPQEVDIREWIIKKFS